ncbi:hypothetical protein [Sorangium sp. So ce854]|uniref:hypothetical protein n=1 Tax=Sorangium sp. So ce854 TaxID=3133322 RepID=UPI003F602546
MHFSVRLRERKVDMQDVFNAIEKAISCTAYANGIPTNGGTCWRVVGPNIDEDEHVAIGIEAFLDKKKRRCVLCTVFRISE